MRTRDPLPGLPAKYATTCPRCDEPINPGDRIAFSRGRPIHCACVGGGDE